MQIFIVLTTYSFLILTYILVYKIKSLNSYLFFINKKIFFVSKKNTFVSTKKILIFFYIYSM